MHRPASTPSAAETVRIARVGAEGDGDAGGFFVPFTLPGELVSAHRAGSRGSLVEIMEPSAERVAPPCPHFGTCGGCALQHWQDAAYIDWKSGLLRAALTRAGFDDPPVAPIARTGPHERRRVDLAVRRVQGGGIAIGLHRMASGDVFDMTACTVMHPALFELIAPLRELLRGLALLKREGSALLNLLDTGPDLLLRSDAEPGTVDRARLAAFAQSHGIPRICWARGDGAPETVAMLSPASLSLSGVTVTPPPGGFLQASRAGEQAIIDAVLAGLPDRLPAKARAAELYAGCGTITFALARRLRVSAFEGDWATHAALNAGAGSTSGRVMTVRRDLLRQPLSAKELAPFAAVILDPPHMGAAVQIAEIAASRASRVIYVSCNPSALARDASVLRAAGYKLLSATPIDQFLWSARLESVCVFSR